MKFEKKILKRSEPKQMKIKSAMVLFLIMLLLIVANGLLIMHFKAWSVIEGVYFWFITFTTIGFGDYVFRPSQRIKQLSLNSSASQKSSNESPDAEDATVAIFSDLFFTFYKIFTLCIVSSVLNSIMAAIEERKCRPRCPGCVPRKTQDRVKKDDGQCSDTPKQSKAHMTYLSMENYGLQKDNMLSLSITELK